MLPDGNDKTTRLDRFKAKIDSLTVEAPMIDTYQTDNKSDYDYSVWDLGAMGLLGKEASLLIGLPYVVKGAYETPQHQVPTALGGAIKSYSNITNRPGGWGRWMFEQTTDALTEVSNWMNQTDTRPIKDIVKLDWEGKEPYNPNEYGKRALDNMGNEFIQFGKKRQKELEPPLPLSPAGQFYYDLGAGASTIGQSFIVGGAATLLSGGNPTVGMTAGFGYTAMLEGGLAYQTAIDNGANENTASDVGIIIGILNGGLEFLPTWNLVKKVGASKKIIEDVTKKLLQKEDAVKLVTKFALTQGRDEATTEALQEVTNLVAESVYKDSPPEFKEWVDRIGYSAFLGFILGAVSGGGAGFIDSRKEGISKDEAAKQFRDIMVENIKSADLVNKQNIYDGLSAILQFGSAGPTKLDGLTDPEFAAGKEEVDKNLPNNITNTLKDLEGIEEINVVDLSLVLGRKVINDFVSGINTTKDDKSKLFLPIDQDGTFESLNKEELHEISTQLLDNAVTIGMINNVAQALGINFDNLTHEEKQIRRNLIGATVLGMGESSLYLYAELNKDKMSVEEFADISQKIQKFQETEQGKKSIEDGKKALNQAYRNIYKVVKKAKTREAMKTANEIMESVGNTKYLVDDERLVDDDTELYEADGWHGSPHGFDKFSLNKIGTGEGAQAYGYGLYFSSKKEIAEYYAKELARRVSNREQIFSKPEFNTPKHWAEYYALRDLFEESSREYNEAAARFVDEDEWSKYKIHDGKEGRTTYAESEKDVQELTRDGWIELGPIMTEDGLDLEFWRPFTEEEKIERQKSIENVENLKQIFMRRQAEFIELKQERFIKAGRNLYKVKLWEGKEQNLLDWDKQITKQQILQIKTQAKKENISLPDDFELGRDPEDGGETEINGYSLYNILKGTLAIKKSEQMNNQAQDKNDLGYEIFYRGDVLASEFLKRAGFDGIQYAGRSSGETNYVVFSDEDIKIEDHRQFESEFGQPNPLKTQATRVSYGNLLNTFKGQTVGELLDWLLANDIMKDNPLFNINIVKSLIELVSDNISEYQVKIEAITKDGKQKRGSYLDQIVTINPNIKVFNPSELGITILHEVAHGLLRDYIRNNPKGAVLRGKINSMLIDIISTLSHPAIRGKSRSFTKITDQLTQPVRVSDKEAMNQLIDSNIDLFNHYFNPDNVDEFLSALLSGHPVVIEALSYIEYGSRETENGKVTYKNIISHILREIAKFFRSIMTTKYAESPTILDELTDLLAQEAKELYTFHGSRKTPIISSLREVALRSNLLKTGEDLTEDVLDTETTEREAENEDEDADIAAEKVVEITIATSIAEALGMNLTEFYSFAKSMDVDSFREKLTELNDEAKTNPKDIGPIARWMEDLYQKNYRRSGFSIEDFKVSIVTRLHNRASEVKPQDHYSVDITYDYTKRQTAPGKPAVFAKVRREREVFKDAKGKLKSSLKESIPLESYIPALEKALGVTPGSIKIAFINSFNTYNNLAGFNTKKLMSSVSVSGLSPHKMGRKGETEINVQQQLAELFSGIPDTINDRQLIFMGTFGDKNTLPVLVIQNAENTTDKDGNIVRDVKGKAQKSQTHDYDKFLNSLEKYRRIYKMEDTPLGRAMTIRAMLEDIYMRVDMEKLTTETSKALKMDFNTDIQKRATKWIFSKKKMATGLKSIRSLFRQDGTPVLSKYNGFFYDNRNNEVELNSIIIDTNNDEIIEIDGKQYSLGKLLKNKLGTTRSDGASFYVKGTLDNIYHLAYGTLKDGTLKSVLGAQGQNAIPLFVKHAKHPLDQDDILARWMIKNNIALIISDTAVKVGKQDIGKVSVAELAAGLDEKDDRIIRLRLSDFHRYKEETDSGVNSDRPKQTINGSSVGSFNTIFEGIVGIDKLDQNLIDLVNKIGSIYNDKQKEFTIDKALKLIVELVNNPTTPEEKALSRILSPIRNIDINTKKGRQLLKTLYGGLIHHPSIASYINKTLKKELANTLKMNIFGSRFALGPGMGNFAKSSQVDPITSDWNIKSHLGQLAFNDDVFKEAIPEEGLRDLIIELREAQVRQTIAITKGVSKKIKDELRDDVIEIRERINEVAGEASEPLVEQLRELGTKESKDKADLELMEELQNQLDRYDSLKIREIVDKGKTKKVQSISKAYRLDGPKVAQWKTRLVNSIIDEEGFLKGNWIIVSENEARRKGLRAGDRALAKVTPTDSPLGITTVRIAAIVPDAVLGASRAIFNSEYIQTLVGKDYDIDTVSITAYDPDVWESNQWDNILNIFEETKDKYIKGMISTINKVFKDNGIIPRDENGEKIDINETTIHSEKIRTLYAQALLGESKIATTRKFAINNEDDFSTISNSYSQSPEKGRIIQTRLYHTLLSAMGIKGKLAFPTLNNEGKVIATKDINFDINGSHWKETHILHLILTNHLLDFPNNTSKLLYNNNILTNNIAKAKLFQRTWGLTDEEADIVGDVGVEAITEVTQILFGKLFLLAQEKSPTGGTADYFDLIKTILDQRRINKFIREGNTQELIQLYADYINDKVDALKGDEKEKADAEALAGKKFEIGVAFIKGMNFSKAIDKYPLTNLIETIKIEDIPFFGMTFREGVALMGESAWEVAIADQYFEDLLEKYVIPKYIGGQSVLGGTQGRVLSVRDKDTKARYKGIRLKDGVYTPDELAILLYQLPATMDILFKREDSKLQIIQRAAVAVAHGLTEFEIGDSNDSAEYKLNQAARAMAFPILVKNIFTKGALKFKGVGINITLKHGGRSFQVVSGAKGNLLVREANKYYESEALAEQAPDIYKIFTEEGGIWENVDNRKAFNTVIDFQENLTSDERTQVFLEWIGDKLYRNKDPRLGRRDIQAFWYSFVGHLSHLGLKDKRAVGTEIRRAIPDMERPYDYAGNRLILEAMAEYEPATKDALLFEMNNRISQYDRAKLTEVVEGIQSGAIFVDDQTLFEEDFETTPQKSLIDNFYSVIKDLDVDKMKHPQLREFRNKVNKGKTLKEKQTIAKSELVKLTKDISVMMGLSSKGIHAEQIVHDLNKLSTSEFYSKYNDANLPYIMQTFEEMRNMAESHLEGKYGIIPNVPGGSTAVLNITEQLFMSFLDAKKNQLRSESIPPNLLLNFWSLEDWATQREKKNLAFRDATDPNTDADEVGFMMTPEDSRVPVSRDTVERLFRILPTTTPKLVGETSIAIKKAGAIKLTLNYKKVEMAAFLETIDKLRSLMLKTSFFKDSRRESVMELKDQNNRGRDPRLGTILEDLGTINLTPNQIADLVFRTAEDLYDRTGIRVFRNSNTGGFIFEIEPWEKRDKKGRRIKRKSMTSLQDPLQFDNIYDLIDYHMPKASAFDKMIFIQAMEYRKMYDVVARELVVSSMEYIVETFDAMYNKLGSIGEGVSYGAALLQTYDRYLKAIDSRNGDYMPHAYPEVEWEGIFKSDLYDEIKSAVTAQVKQAKTNLKNNKRLPNTMATWKQEDIEREVERRLESRWQVERAAHPGGAFIPNFQRRFVESEDVHYDRVSDDPHLSYIMKTIEGLGRDLLKLDFYHYEIRARKIGENPAVINATKNWFADQVNDKMLHTKKIERDDVEKGMTISFLNKKVTSLIPDEEDDVEIRVFGTVKKIDKERGTITLYQDPDKVRYEAKRKLEKYQMIYDSMEELFNSRPDIAEQDATEKQRQYIKGLIADGYIENIYDLESMTKEEASDLIYVSLEDAVQNPDKLATYKLDDIYTLRPNGQRDDANFDRYMRRGSIEYLQGRAREIKNVNSMQGRYDSTMQASKYAALTSVAWVLDKTLAAERKLVGWLVLAFLNAPMAFSRNFWGLIIANTVMMPYKALRLGVKGGLRWWNLRNQRLESMDNNDKSLWKMLTAFNISSVGNLMNIVMGSLNLKGKESLNDKGPLRTLWYAMKLFHNSTGYKNYANEMRVEQRKMRMLSSRVRDRLKELGYTKDDKVSIEDLNDSVIDTNINEKTKVVNSIKRLRKYWKARAYGMIMEDMSKVSPEEIDEKLKILSEQEAENKELGIVGKEINAAFNKGITEKEAVYMAFRAISKWFYQSAPFGLKVQSLAEIGRIPSFFVGYGLAKELHNLDEAEAMQYGANYVEAMNALYGPDKKQWGANTKAGASIFQFVQYVYNSISKQQKMIKEALLQYKGAKDDITKYSWLTGTIETLEEVRKKHLGQTKFSKKDVFLARALMLKWVIGLMNMQIGMTGLVAGWQYIQDPMIQITYDLIDKIMKYFLPDDDDDKETEEIKRDILEVSQEILYFTGTPIKTGLRIALRPEEKDAWDAVVEGRIGKHFNTMNRMYNSFRDPQKMTGKEKKMIFFDSDYLFNSFSGFNIFGTRKKTKEPEEYYAPSVFFDDVRTSIPYDRPFNEDEPWSTFNSRVTESIDPTSIEFYQRYIPWTDRVFGWLKNKVID